MLDLLLDRAYQAHDLVLRTAEAVPNELELRRIKLSDEYCELMYEVLLAIAAEDGQHVLNDRKEEIAEFGELFASVLWQMASQHEQMQRHLHQLLCAKCRANLRRSKYEFN